MAKQMKKRTSAYNINKVQEVYRQREKMCKSSSELMSVGLDYMNDMYSLCAGKK